MNSLFLAENYCSCENCKGGFPVQFPGLGVGLISTGRYEKPAHQDGMTLFVPSVNGSLPMWQTEVGVWVAGKHPAHVQYLSMQEVARSELVASAPEMVIIPVNSQYEEDEEDEV